MIGEPWIEAGIYVPDEHLGPILKLCRDRCGIQRNPTYVAGRAQLTYELVPRWAGVCLGLLGLLRLSTGTSLFGF